MAFEGMSEVHLPQLEPIVLSPFGFEPFSAYSAKNVTRVGSALDALWTVNLLTGLVSWSSQLALASSIVDSELT